MLSKNMRRGGTLLAFVSVLLIVLIATTALAATRLIKAEKGGVISMGKGAKLVIAPEALEEDTVISAEMEKTEKALEFYFGPRGTDFDPPAELRITWQALGGRDVEDITLYDEDGGEIDEDPEIRNWGVVFHIDHFSIYYYRRR